MANINTLLARPLWRYDGQAAVDVMVFPSHVGTKQTESRGKLWIESATQSQPRIMSNYISQPTKTSKIGRDTISSTREVLEHLPLDTYRGEEIQPDYLFKVMKTLTMG